MNQILCQHCGELVESKTPVDVPAGITLCDRVLPNTLLSVIDVIAR